jgi:hypothetical protein
MSFPSPVKRLRGEGKDMVSERPPCNPVGTGTQIIAALPQHQINSSQLNSIACGSGVHLLSGTGGTEWRYGDFEVGGARVANWECAHRRRSFSFLSVSISRSSRAIFSALFSSATAQVNRVLALCN